MSEGSAWIGSTVKVLSGRYDGNVGKVRVVRAIGGCVELGVVFDWDMGMFPVFFPENELEEV